MSLHYEFCTCTCAELERERGEGGRKREGGFGKEPQVIVCSSSKR